MGVQLLLQVVPPPEYKDTMVDNQEEKQEEKEELEMQEVEPDNETKTATTTHNTQQDEHQMTPVDS